MTSFCSESLAECKDAGEMDSSASLRLCVRWLCPGRQRSRAASQSASVPSTSGDTLGEGREA
jgi:hypothetical protein